MIIRADTRFAPSHWETSLHCNDVSHWLGASLESTLDYCLLLIVCRRHTICGSCHERVGQHDRVPIGSLCVFGDCGGLQWGSVRVRSCWHAGYSLIFCVSATCICQWCQTNSPITGDWRRHDAHITSKRYVSIVASPVTGNSTVWS